jgi:hypothetical protein
MAAMQHQMAQQVAFSQIPDVVKRVSGRPKLGDGNSFCASLSFNSTKPFWTTTFPKSRMLMIKGGTGLRRSFTPRQSGQKLNSLRRSSTMVSQIN